MARSSFTSAVGFAQPCSPAAIHGLHDLSTIIDLWLRVYDLTSSSQLPTIEIDPTCGEVEVYLLPLSPICRATPSARNSRGGRLTIAMPGARKLAPSLAAMRLAARLPGVNLRSAAVVS